MFLYKPAATPSLLFVAPRRPMCRPEHFFVAPRRKPRGLLMKHHPERSEGSLGTFVPREDMDGLSPRGVSQGVSLGTPSRPGDAIPNQGRGVSLSLDKTKSGGLAG